MFWNWVGVWCLKPISVYRILTKLMNEMGKGPYLNLSTVGKLIEWLIGCWNYKQNVFNKSAYGKVHNIWVCIMKLRQFKSSCFQCNQMFSMSCTVWKASGHLCYYVTHFHLLWVLGRGVMGGIFTIMLWFLSL